MTAVVYNSTATSLGDASLLAFRFLPLRVLYSSMFLLQVAEVSGLLADSSRG